MSIIKETKEFFLRDKQISAGENADKETGFPVEYKINDNKGGFKTVFNRFLKGHYPSENVFKKLFESIPFFLNKDSTATNNQQGLVKIANSEQVRTNTDKDNSEFQYVVEPSKTTEIQKITPNVEDINEDENYDKYQILKDEYFTEDLSITLDTETTTKGKIFKTKLSEKFLNWLGKAFNLIFFRIANGKLEGQVSYSNHPEAKNKIIGQIQYIPKNEDTGIGDYFRFYCTIYLPEDFNNPLDKIYDIRDIHIKTNLDDFNFSTGLPTDINGKWKNWRIADGRNGTDDFRGRTLVQLSMRRGGESWNNTNLNEDFSEILNTTGEFKHILNTAELPQHRHTISHIYSSPGVGGSFSGGSLVSTIQGNDHVWNTNYAGENTPHNNIQPSITILIIQKIA